MNTLLVGRISLKRSKTRRRRNHCGSMKTSYESFKSQVSLQFGKHCLGIAEMKTILVGGNVNPSSLDDTMHPFLII